MFKEYIPVTKTQNGITINIKVSAGAKASKIGKVIIHNDISILKLSVNKPRENGKANEGVIDLLAKSFCLPKSSIQIIKGQTDTNKVIEIFGDPDKLYAQLKNKFNY